MKKKRKRKRKRMMKSSFFLLNVESNKYNRDKDEKKTPVTKRGRPKKTPTPSTRKKPAKLKPITENNVEDEENEEENEENNEEKVLTRKKTVKKQKISTIKVKITKTVDIEEKNDDEEEDQEEEEEKPKKTKGKKKVAKPLKFKKGKINPNVEIVDTCDMLESKDNNIIDYGSIKANNKNIIRAVYTKNHILLKKILDSEYLVSTHYDKWGPETSFNAFELLFKNKDKAGLKFLLENYNRKIPQKMAALPSCGLKEITTGYNSVYTFGHKVRKVNVSRGGREGNNAFVSDLHAPEPFEDDSLNKIFEMDFDTEMLDILRIGVQNFDNIIESKIPIAIRSGNYKLAGHLVSFALKRGGFGFNFLHDEVLNKNDPNNLSPFKKASCTKKTYIGESVITPIHCAAINPNPKILEALFDVSPEFSIPDDKLRKPVHYAAACEGPGPLELLINRGVDTREGDQMKNTPLMYACYYGRVKNVELLLATDGRSHVDAKNKDGMMAVHLATMQGHLDVLKLLQKKGADINSTGRFRMTPLNFAAAHGHYDCLVFLYENGAKILAKDKLKRSSLLLAARNGNLTIASFLLKNGADYSQPDTSKNYPIHYAAGYGYPEMIELLIKAGANQNVTNSWNISSLTVAMLKNNFECVKKLLLYPDTDVNCKDDQGRTLISSAVDTVSRNSFDHIKYLIIEKKADTNIPDVQGLTVLHYACQLHKTDVSSGYKNWDQLSEKERKRLENEHQELIYELINLLLENGANINQKSNNGLTPFEIALEEQNFDIIDILINRKDLDLSITNNDDQGIYHFLSSVITSEEGIKLFNKVIELVGNNNNIVNLIDADGFTPLLLYVKTFSDKANQIIIEFNERITKEELEKKRLQALKDNPNSLLTNNNINVNAVGMNNGLVAPNPFNFNKPTNLFNTSPFGQIPAQRTRKLPRRQLPVNYNDLANANSFITLTPQEQQECKKRAGEEFDKFTDTFIEILKVFIQLGANPLQTVEKLKINRNKSEDEEAETIEQKHDKYIRKMANKKNSRNNNIFNPRKAMASSAAKSGAGAGAGAEELKRKSHYGPNGLQSILHLIQGFPYKKVLDYILTLGIKINSKDDQERTALYLLIDNNSCYPSESLNLPAESLLEELCTHGADPTIPNYEKNYPILIAVMNNKFNFLESLIKYGANLNVINKKGMTPVIHSVKQNILDNVEKLLELGADPNFRDYVQRTSLHHAVNGSNSNADASFEMESLLLRFGADVNALDNRKRTPLLYAFVKIGKPFDISHIDPVETVTSLCGVKGCDVNIKDAWGSSALHYAAQRGSHICGLYLINTGAEIEALDHDGNTPLGVAMKSSHSNIAIMLIQMKANVNQKAIVKKKKIEKKKNDMDIENEKVASSSENSDEEDEEKINQNPSNFPFGFNPFMGFGAPTYHNQNQNQEPNSKLAEGEYSMFTVAIKMGWQGVAYLILQNGYDLMKALMVF